MVLADLHLMITRLQISPVDVLMTLVNSAVNRYVETAKRHHDPRVTVRRMDEERCFRRLHEPLRLSVSEWLKEPLLPGFGV